MAQMFGHYLHQATNNFDLQTLNLQDSNQNSAATANFVSVDQTFHTPSFGDEEFSIPTLSMPSSDGNGNTGDIFESQALSHPQTQSQEMTIVMASSPSTTIAPQGIVESPTVQYPGHNMEEMYLPQMREIQPGGGIEMQNIQMLNQSYANHPNNFDQMQTMPPPQVPLSTQPSVMHGHTSLLTTISQTQLMTQLGMKAPLGMARQQGPGSMGSSPGSNHTSPGQETSEDSDDNIPLLMSGVKRPSPEPIEPVNNTKSCKKPKVPKKKKKKDPNEPQKPVSAYALFFRDTQAAIKGQNPNASFGEVSKIVASMWDSLDVDHKNVYKKKTEAAKKEYLKALAAYKASLVSRAGAEQSDLYSNPSVSSTTPMTTVAYSGHSPPSLSPLQKKSPLLTSLMEGSTASVVMTQPQAPLVASQVWTPTPQQHMVQGAPLILQQGPILQVHNQQMVPLATAYNQTMQSAQLVSDQTMHVSQTMGQQPQIQQTCLRNGCPNPAIESPDWDKEYCSNECVVSHCRDVFTAWVASRQASNSFTQVK